jgi:hypothetical protein
MLKAKLIYAFHMFLPAAVALWHLDRLSPQLVGELAHVFLFRGGAE